MQMRGDKFYPGRGKWVKIPLLPENVGKRSLNFLGTLGTLERVMTLLCMRKYAYICILIVVT